MILDPLLSVLIIAGIFGSAVAQELISREMEPQRFIPRTDEIFSPSRANSPQTQGTGFAELQSAGNRLKRKCERKGIPMGYDESNIIAAPRNFVNCVNSLVDITQFKAQMAAARLNRGEDIVIRNYCGRVPTFKRCLKNVTESIAPCLDSEERESLNFLYETTSSLLRFACDNGETVKNFIAARGTECMSSKYPAIQRCADLNFPAPGPDAVEIPRLGTLLKLTLDLDGCTNIQNYQTCSIARLESCENPTTAIIWNYLFNLIKTETSCETLLNPQTVRSEVQGPEEATSSTIRGGKGVGQGSVDPAWTQNVHVYRPRPFFQVSHSG